MSKLTQWAINIVVGIFSFIFFVFLFFPFEKIIQNYLAQVEELSGGQYRITVGSMSPSIFFMSEFEKFQIHAISGGQSKVIAYFPKVKLGVKYFPLLTGNIQSSFEISSDKGLMNGEFNFLNGTANLDADLDKFPLQALPIASEFESMNLFSQLSGKLNLEIPVNKFNQTNGSIKLNFYGTNIIFNELEILSGVDLEGLNLSGVNNPGKLLIEVKKGKFDIKQLSFPGPSLAIDGDGWVQVGRKLEFSRLRVTTNLLIDPEIEKKLSILSVLDKQKNADGRYPLIISGKVIEPKMKIGNFSLDVLLGGS